MDGRDCSTVDFRHEHGDRWNRLHIAHFLQGVDDSDPASSLRQFAENNDVPRSTLQEWVTRRKELNLPPDLARFFESPQGVEFLHRLMIALHLVFVHQGGCGLRKVTQFLHLTGLDQVVAPSTTNQNQFCQTMSQQIVEYGKEQQRNLSDGMTTREIAVCEDETFHPQICLVAMEPSSGFILLEQYADHRDAETWEKSLREATLGMPVKIVQVVSDEAKGLIAHAHALDAHHSPDLFHVQQELCRATSTALAGQTRRAEAAHVEASQQADRHSELAAACEAECGESSAAAELAAAAAAAQHRAEAAAQAAETCRQREQQAQQARRGVSDAYHPFDLTSGAAKDAEQVQEELEKQFEEIERVANEAGLSSACHERIAKARRLVVKMAATLVFFWRMVHEQLEGLSLSPEIEAILLKEILPAKYFELASAKATAATRRLFLKEQAKRLGGMTRDGPWSNLPEAERLKLEEQATAWAELFQRSSSCVEGRNGQLSLWHHSLHGLSPLRLAALTVLHNYHLCRKDETTAAERFFGKAPCCLVEWLMANVPYPSRPAPRRKAG